MDLSEGISEDDLLILADAQTSGGLLIAVLPEKVEQLKAELMRNNVPIFAEIGEILTDHGSRILITP